MKLGKIFAALLVCSLMQGCVVEQIVKGTVVDGQPNPETTLPWSENGAYSKNGRFFIVGGEGMIYFNPSSIYEIVQNEDGTYTNEVLVTGDVNGGHCYFSGLTSKRNKLYASCVQMGLVEFPGVPEPMYVPVANKIYIVDLDQPIDSEDYITTTLLQTQMFTSNGMAVDRNGDLYISNTTSYLTSIYGLDVPAILKLSFGEEGSVTETAWLPSAQGGISPNGLQYQFGSLYLASSNKIFKIKIDSEGNAGEITTAYETDPAILIDDFDIKGSVIAAAQIKTIIPEIILSVYPDAVIPEEQISKVVVINARTGDELGEQSFEGGALPSSVKFGKWPLFEPYSLIVTDAIGTGGLYQLKLEQEDLR